MTSCTVFKNTLLSFNRPKNVDRFGIPDSTGMQLLMRLQLGFSQLIEHKITHNFCNFFNPYVSVGWNQIQHPINDIKEIDERIISGDTSILDLILLCGNEIYNHYTNKYILLSTIKFCADSKRFDMPLL